MYTNSGCGRSLLVAVLGRVGRRVRIGGCERLVGVLPEALGLVPSPPPDLGLEPILGEDVADHPLGLVRGLGGLRVDVHPLAVAGDDHAVAEPLGDLVVEVERPQALGEPPVHRLVDVDLDPEFVAGHRGARLAAAPKRLTAMDQVIQVIGALLILAGFAGAQVGRLRVDSRAYLVLNLVGSAVLAYLALARAPVGVSAARGRLGGGLGLEPEPGRPRAAGRRRALRPARPRPSDRAL